MKTICGGCLTWALIASVSANDTLSSNGSPLALQTSDKSIGKVSLCNKFIELRWRKKTVTDYPCLLDPEYHVAKKTLSECGLQAYIVSHHYMQIPPATLKRQDVLFHFETTSASLFSNEEIHKINTRHAGKISWIMFRTLKFLATVANL